ncbi:HPP family protein [Desulfosediminicola flagellatus]|uniref:CBS domain-containing protein n=1 Tax=Desulfosediminicola flagellatus TaxID=2569541 RepID=UPI0010ABE2B2|nr:CBS domain-containing protein [Desulfosediminicola flagellatus]
MQSLKVKDIMVPTSEYTTISKDATLHEAIIILGNAQVEFNQAKNRHRAILVLDSEGQVVGKLSQIDVIRGLEPGYRDVKPPAELKHWALSKETIANMMKDMQLWQKPLEDICKKSDRIYVRDLMYTPAEGEYVSQDATLDEAVHQLVIGHHQSLLVVEDNNVTGILRLTDVFSSLVQVVKQCEM